MIYRFDILTSTNDEIARPDYAEGDIVFAESQSAGRGQRGHTWESQQGENATFSMLFKPHFLAPDRQFLLSEMVALGVTDTLSSYGIEAQIKWTNDIYVGDRKIAGILIEHKLTGANIDRTIVGVGLNINQRHFSEHLPNPTSMALEANSTFDRHEVLEHFSKNVMYRYEQLQSGKTEQIQADYHSLLYHRNAEHWYALPDGSRFRGTIMGVEPTGALLVKNEQGEVRAFLFKEIEFLLKTEQ